MRENIQEYWKELQKEYQQNYRENIFQDYEKSKPFVEKFKCYLEERRKENPKDVDVICALATVMQELRKDRKSIKLLEEFLKTYEAELGQKDKARIYTNLAFYHSGCEKEIEYLQKAEHMKSSLFETYNGLGQCYFSKYHFEEEKESLEKSLIAFEKSFHLNHCYKIQLNYAACLFELKQYEKAKEIFEKLLVKYPNRMRLLLSIAYCDIYLGNKKEALEYLKQVKEGEDENYHRNTDDIGEFEIYDAYYVLEEYQTFIELGEKEILNYYQSERYTYYFALWITKQYEKFGEVIEKHKQEILSWIEETKVDEDFEEEEERIGYIQSYQEDLNTLLEMENKIRNEKDKPVVKLNIYPEYGCYLVDCIRHSF